MTERSPTKVLFSTFDVVPDTSGNSVRSTGVLESIGAYFEVDALTAKTPNHAHIERYHGARLLRVPVGSGDVRSRAEAFDRAVRRQLQSEDYGVVHFTDPFGGYALCELRPNFGYKLIYDLRGFPSVELRYTEPHLEGDRKFLTKLRRQEIFCLMNADLVLAPCRLTLDHIVSLGVPAEKVHVLPPPVDLARFSVETPVNDDPCRFLYLGSHASWQGLPSLIFALRKAANKTKFAVKIAGPSHGSWRQQLEDMVREFDLRGSVKIEHPVSHEDVPKLLEWSNVGLAPLMKVDRNIVQGSAPLKIAEYMVAGRPVVASNLPMCSDMLENELTGLLFPATDEDALAECLVHIASDVDLRVRMSREARSRGCARYDSRSFRSRLMQVYHLLVSPSAVAGQGRLDLDQTPTGRRSPTDPMDPTVTLPAGARPGEPPPVVPTYVEPPTQTSLPLATLPPEPPQEEATCSVNMAEMPWSGGGDEGEGPEMVESVRIDTSPGLVVTSPDEDETPLPERGVIQTQAGAPADVAPALESHLEPAPPDDDEPPLPRDGELSAVAEPPEEDSPALRESSEAPLQSVIVADDDADPSHRTAEREAQAPPPRESPKRDEVVTTQRDLEAVEAEPEHPSLPITEPLPASEPSAQAVPVEPSPEEPKTTGPSSEPAPTETAAEKTGPGGDSDEPVEIDPKEAILLDDSQDDGNAPEAFSTVDEDAASVSSDLVGKEPEPEALLPVVRGMLIGDGSPVPDQGQKPGNRRVNADEDTNPGFKT